MELLEKLEGRNEDIEYIQYGNYSKDNDDFDMNRQNIMKISDIIKQKLQKQSNKNSNKFKGGI